MSATNNKPPGCFLVSSIHCSQLPTIPSYTVTADQAVSTTVTGVSLHGGLLFRYPTNNTQSSDDSTVNNVDKSSKETAEINYHAQLQFKSRF